MSAVLAEIQATTVDLAADATLLDVATGVGDIPHAAASALSAHGIKLTTIGLDSSEALAREAGKCVTASLCADALSLPFRTNSVDVVLCSQFLHHLLPAESEALIHEMNRVARVRVVISDLRRSWLAAGGLWVASFPLRFHPISRHDGVVSVMRGFTPTELSEIVRRALGIEVKSSRRKGFRVTTSWAPVRS